MTERHEWWNSALLDENAEDLYEHAPCGYLSLLSDGTIAKVNATFLSWTGFTRDALVGYRRFPELLNIGGRIFYETHFEPLLRMQGFVREIAFDLTCADGRRLPILVNASQRDYEGAGMVTRITVFDATDRRQYERELVAARVRAEDAARAKSQLVAMISHDLRAPLSALMTAVALLEKTTLTAQQSRYARVLRSSSGHALELVNNVLAAASIESGRAQLRESEFSLRALVEEVAVAARAAAVQKPAIAIEVRVDDRVPERLVGDKPKLHHVLTNLVMNAVKFTHQGLVSAIVALREESPEDVTVEVLVSDTGIGIPADRLPHIFEEFTQGSDEVAEKYGGTGLGLSISRRLLQLHGADLHVTSTVGQGSTFSFLLTLKRSAGDAPAGEVWPRRT